MKPFWSENSILEMQSEGGRERINIIPFTDFGPTKYQSLELFRESKEIEIGDQFLKGYVCVFRDNGKNKFWWNPLTSNMGGYDVNVVQVKCIESNFKFFSIQKCKKKYYSLLLQTFTVFFGEFRINFVLVY